MLILDNSSKTIQDLNWKLVQNITIASTVHQINNFSFGTIFKWRSRVDQNLSCCKADNDNYLLFECVSCLPLKFSYWQFTWLVTNLESLSIPGHSLKSKQIWSCSLKENHLQSDVDLHDSQHFSTLFRDSVDKISA